MIAEKPKSRMLVTVEFLSEERQEGGFCILFK